MHKIGPPGSDEDLTLTTAAAVDPSTVTRRLKAAPSAAPLAPPTRRITAVEGPEASAAHPAEPGDTRASIPLRSGVALFAVLLAAVATAIAVGGALGHATTGTDTEVTTLTPDRRDPPQDDVSLATCTADAAGAHASGNVSNQSSYDANYVLGLVLVDRGGREITRGSAVVPGVAAGAGLSWAATMPARPSSGSEASCRIASVDRYRAEQR